MRKCGCARTHVRAVHKRRQQCVRHRRPRLCPWGGEELLCVGCPHTHTSMGTLTRARDTHTGNGVMRQNSDCPTAHIYTHLAGSTRTTPSARRGATWCNVVWCGEFRRCVIQRSATCCGRGQRGTTHLRTHTVLLCCTLGTIVGECSLLVVLGVSCQVGWQTLRA